MDVSPRRGADLFERLLKRGIIVRSMDEYGFPHHIRVTYGLPEENKSFLKALKAVIPECLYRGSMMDSRLRPRE